MSNFHGTEFEIWLGFGPVGITKKKIQKKVYKRDIMKLFWEAYYFLFFSVMPTDPKPAQISNSVSCQLLIARLRYNDFAFALLPACYVI